MTDSYTLNELQQSSADRMSKMSATVLALSLSIVYELHKIVKCK